VMLNPVRVTANRAPVIGVTSSIPTGEPVESFAHLAPYMNALRTVGAEPLALRNDPALAGEYLGRVDALLFGGGSDVDPQRYGEASGPKTKGALREREEFEIELVRAARERGIPTLCICRGLQIANVAFGGTLIQDLPDHFGEHYPIDHQQMDHNGVERSDYAPGHAVYVDPDSALARLVGSISFPANSMHHQAVGQVAPEFQAVAWTSDGVIEAIDARFAHPFFFCVQWHPEEFVGDDAIAERLFRAFVRAASEYGRTRSGPSLERT